MSSRSGRHAGAGRRRLLGGPALLVLVVFGFGVAACGRGGQPVETGAGAPVPSFGGTAPLTTPSPGASGATAPTPTSAASASPSTTALLVGDGSAGPAAAAPQDWRTLPGFAGRYFTDNPTRGALVVLDETVRTTTTADGSWAALGLVRNEEGSTTDRIEVQAQLLAADGSVLETAVAESPVLGVRPGEPAPFTLTSTTPASEVADVRWSAGPRPAASAPAATREVEVATYWTRSPSDARRVDLPLHHDPPSGPRPFLQFGSVTNLGGAVIANPAVALAWLDADGRVALVQTAPLVDPDGAALAALAPGEASDYLAVVADPTAAGVAGAGTAMLWAGAS